MDEKMAENAQQMGELFREQMKKTMSKTSLIQSVRGKGLLNALIMKDDEKGKLTWEICLGMKENGLLAKPTHGNIIRLAPPLVITKDQILEGCEIIEKSILEIEKKK